MDLKLSVLVVVLSVACDGTAAADQGDAAVGLVRRYADHILAGELDAAAALWSPDCLTASRRLGITYPEAPLAVDLASPLRVHLVDLRAGRVQLAIGEPEETPAGLVVSVTLPADRTRPPYRYAVIAEAGVLRLAHATWAATRDWPRTDSTYFTFLCRDVERLTPAAIASLDGFVVRTADDLGLTPQRLAELRDMKIPYVLADAAMVADLTGFATKGMTDLGAGMIVTSHLPHDHEVAHLLANFALGDAPLQPLPVLQEGLATLLGGRWGRAPEVILHMDWVNAGMGLSDVGDILTPAGFHGSPGGPDTTYPAAAVLCDAIVAAAGWPALLELQRTLANRPGGPPARDPNRIAAAIAAICGWDRKRPRAALVAACADRRDRYRRAGVAPGLPPGVAVDRSVLSAGENVVVQPAGRHLVFGVPAGDTMVTILPERPGQGLSAAGSLFAEILPGRAYAGERCAVRCSAGSISVYDIAANRLVGLWVGDFVGEQGAAESAPGWLVFHVDRSLPPHGTGADWSVVAR